VLLSFSLSEKIKSKDNQDKMEMQVSTSDPRKINNKKGADLFDMEEEENGHKSITARVPEGFSDSVSHI